MQIEYHAVIAERRSLCINNPLLLLLLPNQNNRKKRSIGCLLMCCLSFMKGGFTWRRLPAILAFS